MRIHVPIIPLLAACLCLPACRPDYVKRYDKPLSYEDASKRKDIDFPLPASSQDIYYGMYADWQAYERLVRFKAPVQDCLSQIAAVIAWDDKIYSRTSSYSRVTITHVDAQGGGWLGVVPWFTPETLTNGVYVGKN